MNEQTLAAVLRGVAAVVQEHVGALLEPIRAENAELRKALQSLTPQDRFVDLERRLDGISTQKGDKGDRGDDGVVDVEQFAAAVKSAAEMVAGVAVDGLRGPVLERLADVERRLADMPGASEQPPQAEPDLAAVEHLVEERVARAFQALPLPRDGRDADASLVRELVQSEVAKIEKPKDGKDGRDAVIDLALAGVDLTLDADGRTLVFTLPQPDGSVLEKRLRTAANVDAGVYRRDATYVRGDGVTHEGGYWIALRDDPGQITGDGWRCSVRRGRQGDKGDRGDKGMKGEDGKDIGPDGRAWT